VVLGGEHRFESGALSIGQQGQTDPREPRMP
jgi:hypothetical protein